MKDIAILGVGGLGREVLALIKDINNHIPTWNVIGFFDDACPKGQQVNGIPVLGNMDALNDWNTDLAVVVAIGTSDIREKVVSNIINRHISFPTLIHPSVIISDRDYITIGSGAVICAGCILTTNITIGDFVLLNLACTVGHDAVLESYTSFMPQCSVSGEVHIERGAYCGTGVKIINRITIGSYAIVGAGAVVVSDMPAHTTIVGVPAKVIKTNK